MIKKADLSAGGKRQDPRFPAEPATIQVSITEISTAQLIAQISSLGNGWNYESEKALHLPHEAELPNGKFLQINRKDGWVIYTNSSDPDSDYILRSLIRNLQFSQTEKPEYPPNFYAIGIHSKLDTIHLYLFDSKHSLFMNERMICMHPQISSTSSSKISADDLKIDWSTIVQKIHQLSKKN